MNPQWIEEDLKSVRTILAMISVQCDIFNLDKQCFMLYYSVGSNICGTMFYMCYVNYLCTTTYICVLGYCKWYSPNYITLCMARR
jgi:hypothetical protein